MLLVAMLWLSIDWNGIEREPNANREIISFLVNVGMLVKRKFAFRPWPLIRK